MTSNHQTQHQTDDTKVIIKTKINKTESPEKIKKAIKNIINPNIAIKKENDTFSISGDLDLLYTISNKIRENELESVAQLVLKKNKTDNSLKFYINKQAAYHNRFHIIDEDISTLNDIEVLIKTDDPEDIINWIIF